MYSLPYLTGLGFFDDSTLRYWPQKRYIERENYCPNNFLSKAYRI